MRAVLQRVSEASVEVDQKVVGQIRQGWLVLLGFRTGDTQNDLDYIIKKTVGLRLFSDEGGRFNLSAEDIGGEILVVSQFTLHADTRKGRRPSFTDAASPEEAKELWNKAVEAFQSLGLRTSFGEFGANMKVRLENDGPVTIILESPNEADE